MIFGTNKLHKATNGMLPTLCQWMHNTLGAPRVFSRVRLVQADFKESRIRACWTSKNVFSIKSLWQRSNSRIYSSNSIQIFTPKVYIYTN